MTATWRSVARFAARLRAKFMNLDTGPIELYRLKPQVRLRVPARGLDGGDPLGFPGKLK